MTVSVSELALVAKTVGIIEDAIARSDTIFLLPLIFEL